MEQLKVCPSCDPNGERPKSGEAFYKNLRHRDNLSSYCKECTKLKVFKYNTVYREKRNARQTAWRKNNPEKAKAQRQRTYDKRLKDSM